MAVTLTLRQLFEFQADHPQEEVERIARIPVKHFNVLFCPLFGLQPLPAGTYPCTVVDSIRTFLMTMARHKNWFLLRINKFRWAYKKRRDFLIAVIHLHRDRWNAALQVWAAAESEQRATLTKFLRRMKEKDPAGASMPKQARRKSTKQTTWDAYGPAELAGVPVAKKKEAIVELHRRRLVDVTHALRAWLQQNTALQKVPASPTSVDPLQPSCPPPALTLTPLRPYTHQPFSPEPSQTFCQCFNVPALSRTHQPSSILSLPTSPTRFIPRLVTPSHTQEVKQISKQVAARWWKLDLSRRITPDIVPMATRLESLRTRALMNCFVKPRVQALAWRSVSAEELQSFYIQHNPLANDITAVVLQDPWVWQEVRRAQAAEAAEMTAAFRGSVGGKRQYVKQSIEPEPAEIPMFRQQMQNRMASYRFTSPSDTTDDTSDNTSENAPLLKVKGVRAQATGRRQTFCDTDSSGGSFGHDSSPGAPLLLLTYQSATPVALFIPTDSGRTFARPFSPPPPAHSRTFLQGTHRFFLSGFFLLPRKPDCRVGEGWERHFLLAVHQPTAVREDLTVVCRRRFRPVSGPLGLPEVCSLTQERPGPLQPSTTFANLNIPLQQRTPHGIATPLSQG